MDGAQTDAVARLRHELYILLTTFRRDGTPVPTPVWFVADGDRLYVMTLAESGKVKRLRRDARIQVAACTARGQPRGPTFHGVGAILPPAAGPDVERRLNRKYGWVKRGFDLLLKLRRAKRAYLELRLDGPVGDPAAAQSA